MNEALGTVFTNWSYSDWACEKAYNALFIYYPEILNGHYVTFEWLYFACILCLVIGAFLGWYIAKKSKKN